MRNLSLCPNCGSSYIYQNGVSFICSECEAEFQDGGETNTHDNNIVDAVGNILQNGDSVIVNQELRLKGSAKIKKGTKVKNIKLLSEPVDGHNIEAKVDSFGTLYLKSQVVRKA